MKPLFDGIGKNSKILKSIADVYRGITQARRRAYDQGIKRYYRLPRPVISVGNLTVGGTGKTPVVLYLADKLAGWASVSILSKGYGRKSPRSYLTLHDRRELDAKACQIFGDEPVMMAKKLPSNVSIHVGPKRYQLGTMALDRGPVDLFILDDGLQHMELQRDLDIVLLDGQQDPQKLETLPIGPLREPIESISHADIVWINHCNPDGSHRIDMAWLKEMVPDAVIVKSRFIPGVVVTTDSDFEVNSESIKSKTLAAFCGIGKPTSFFHTLEEDGLNVKIKKAFPDHHFFTRKELIELQKEARLAGCTALITTEKDAARINQIPQLDITCYVQKLEIEILDGEEALWEKIGESIKLG